MSRRALILSLGLHAGFAGLIAGWPPEEHSHSGRPTGAVSVSFNDTAESLLLDDLPDQMAQSVPRSGESAIIPAPSMTPVSGPSTTAFNSASIAVPADTVTEETMPVAQPDMVAVKSSRVTEPAAAHAAKIVKHGHGSSGDAVTSKLNGTRSGSSGGYLPPEFRLRYKPAYPSAARAQRLEGTVLLIVSVDRAGRVTRAGVQRSCGHAMLDRAAVDAVRSWRFEPARQDGLPIAAQVEVPVSFRFGLVKLD